jgi:hypothetical protein
MKIWVGAGKKEVFEGVFCSFALGTIPGSTREPRGPGPGAGAVMLPLSIGHFNVGLPA